MRSIGYHHESGSPRLPLRSVRGIAGVAAAVIVWEAVVRLQWVTATMIPLPSDLPRRLMEEIQSGVWHRTVVSSLSHYSIGWAAGTLLGVTAGTLVALLPTVRAWQALLARILRPIPPLAWIPFAIIWFGINRTAAAFIIAIGIFWINYFAAFGAITHVDARLVEVARVFGHHRFPDRVFRVILPAAAPGIVTGVRTGVGQGWMTVVAAELFGIRGIGQRMMEASGLLAIDVVAVYMLTIALLYGTTDLLFGMVERAARRWLT